MVKNSFLTSSRHFPHCNLCLWPLILLLCTFTESDPIFNMFSQQIVVVRLKISSPPSLLESAQAHLSQSVLSCHVLQTPNHLGGPLLESLQDTTIFSCTEVSKTKHITPHVMSQVTDVLNSSWSSFEDCSVSRARQKVGLEPAFAEVCQSNRHQNYSNISHSAWRVAMDKMSRHDTML